MTTSSVAEGWVATTFTPDAQAVGAARRFVAGALDGHATAGTIDIARVLVSELVTNAVVHAASRVEVEVAIDDVAVVVRVRDADTGPLVSRGGGTELDEGGRGFMLVDRMAQSWGTEHSGGRKTVWFRLTLGRDQPDGPQPGEAAAARSTDPPLARARKMLHTLVLSPHLQALLTLREEVREVLTRVVDAVDAMGASASLIGETVPVISGAIENAPTARSVELVVDDRRLGKLTVAFNGDVSDEDDAFIHLAADRLSLLAAENGMLRSEQARGTEHDFLAESTELLAGTTSVALSLTLLTQVVVPRLADWCAALSVDDRGRPRRVTANHKHEERTNLVHIALEGERELAEAIRSAATGGGPQRLPMTVAIGGQRSNVAVLPLASRSRVLGVLVLGASQPLDAVTYMALTELARRAALSVENARLYEEQAASVTALQAALLPTALPSIPGFDLAARYHSASAGMSVGGDFYDAIEMSDGVVLAIGDVCGKGAEAATVTGTSRDVLRLLIQDGVELVAALRRLNRALLGHPASARFCTIALTRLRRDGDRVVARICLGGHPEPVLVRADGSTAFVGRPGDLIGVLDNEHLDLHETDVEIGVGDALVLYTDGVTERRDGRRMFGQYGLRKALTIASGADANALASAVEHAAESFVDTELRDDLAILVVRRVS
jgi:phosphoserine phosphatase RsbU/P